MPMMILAAALVPFGLEGIALAALGGGIAYVLQVAEGISALGGAAGSVPAGSPLALAAIVFCGLWIVIWRGALRAGGLAALMVGIVLWCRRNGPTSSFRTMSS